MTEHIIRVVTIKQAQIYVRFYLKLYNLSK